MHGTFTWIDLSTFDVPKTLAFYQKLLGWNHADDGSGYHICTVGGTPCAGVYEMPEFFQNINMPSFWMTYIAVDDAAAIAEKARQLGGKVELEDTNPLGKITLVRDPAGAGFTCFEGDAPSALTGTPQHGRWRRSELFVSDLTTVEPFYRELFGWSFEPDPANPDRHLIRHADGTGVGAVQVADNATKGDKEFWIPFFATADLDASRKTLAAAGAEIVYDYTTTDGTHLLAKDPQGGAFFLTAASGTSSNNTTTPQPAGAPKWRSAIGLVAVYLAVLFELDWMWGALFLFWVIPDLKSGTTYFIEPLDRRRNPVLYWAVVLTWLALSAYLFISAG